MKILMVCLGNICRSPLAHGILEHKAKELGINITVDSAGTNGYHDGEFPDSRSMEVAIRHGIDLSAQRSRKIRESDLQDFDLIYAMDASNYNNILELATSEEERNKVKMIMNEISPGQNVSIPDPYFGGDSGFQNVYDMLDSACDSILENLKQ